MTAKRLVTEILDGTPNVVLKCQDDEPVFVLVARDMLASAHVRHWAVELESRAQAEGTLTEQRRAKIVDAFAVADAMDEWRYAHHGELLNYDRLPG